MADHSLRPADPRALRARWISLVDDHPATRADGESLLRRWAEPHRSYHNLSHLSAVLAHIDELVHAEPGTATDVDAVTLAAYFHDAVYDPTRQDNESRSAALAHDVLERLGTAGSRVREVARLVLLTATHAVVAGDGDGAVLCDADLAVLAGSPAAYAAYAAAVRAEYAHVPEPLFRAGRAEVLAALLEPDALFQTRTGRVWWERAARRNVETELALLSAQAGGPGEADAARPPAAV